jgi:hypothetical protein
LNFVLHAFICFIRSFKPSKTKLGKLFAYRLIELLEPNKQISMVPFLYVTSLVFTLYSKRLFKSMKGFCSS